MKHTLHSQRSYDASWAVNPSQAKLLAGLLCDIQLTIYLPVSAAQPDVYLSSMYIRQDGTVDILLVYGNTRDTAAAGNLNKVGVPVLVDSAANVICTVLLGSIPDFIGECVPEGKLIEINQDHITFIHTDTAAFATEDTVPTYETTLVINEEEVGLTQDTPIVLCDGLTAEFDDEENETLIIYLDRTKASKLAELWAGVEMTTKAITSINDIVAAPRSSDTDADSGLNITIFLPTDDDADDDDADDDVEYFAVPTVEKYNNALAVTWATPEDMKLSKPFDLLDRTFSPVSAEGRPNKYYPLDDAYFYMSPTTGETEFRATRVSPVDLASIGTTVSLPDAIEYGEDCDLFTGEKEYISANIAASTDFKYYEPDPLFDKATNATEA